MPGLALALAEEVRIDLDNSSLIGGSVADRDLARRIGLRFVEADDYFGGPAA